MSEVSDRIMEKHAESLATVTVLDVSYCSKITNKGLEAVGKSCKLLIQLKRNMPPMELEETERTRTRRALDETEAMAIANTMPGLNRLELAYGRFSDHGLNAILTNCNSLTRLNLVGCLYVDLNGDLEETCERITDFQAPWTCYDDHILAIATASDEDEDEDDD